MKTISIINLKGGVAKTISSVSIAYILARDYGCRVLLVDNDKQGNASKNLNRHNYEHKGTAELLTERNIDIHDIIQKTDYDRLDIITANMNLLRAIMQVQLDQQHPPHTRFKKLIHQVHSEYDFCIIDNAPNIDISTVNAMNISDDILIPVVMDDFSIEGLSEIQEQIEDMKEDMNPGLRLMGCFVTMHEKNNEAESIGEARIQALGCPILKTKIRKTPKARPSTLAQQPLVLYSPRCGAAQDYRRLVEEIVKM